jgi:hypothetical protein
MALLAEVAPYDTLACHINEITSVNLKPCRCRLDGPQGLSGLGADGTIFFFISMFHCDPEV